MAHIDHIPKLSATFEPTDFEMFFKEAVNYGIKYYPDCSRSLAFLHFLKKKTLNKHEMKFFKALGMKLFITGRINMGVTAKKSRPANFLDYIKNYEVEI